MIIPHMDIDESRKRWKSLNGIKRDEREVEFNLGPVCGRGGVATPQTADGI